MSQWFIPPPLILCFHPTYIHTEQQQQQQEACILVFILCCFMGARPGFLDCHGRLRHIQPVVRRVCQERIGLMYSVRPYGTSSTQQL